MIYTIQARSNGIGLAVKASFRHLLHDGSGYSADYPRTIAISPECMDKSKDGLICTHGKTDVA